MGVLRSLIFLQLVYMTLCMDQLDIKYEWTELDYAFETPAAREQALETKTFIPENNIPMGIEIYEDRMFITVPRWRSGVPSTMNYINLKDNSTNSPKLIPYPSWAAHMPGEAGKPAEIISPFRVRADRCGRLWILDSGKMSSTDQNATRYSPAIIVYDLKTDKPLRRYDFPKDQVKEDSGFANIVVEDFDCDKAFAYAGDVGKAGIVVYSWEKNESWRVTHHHFNIDPTACDFNVKGYNFSWTDSIFGLGLSAPNAENYSTLYFHPMSSYNEFSISTEYLRNASLASTLSTENFNASKLLGNRGPNAQSSVSFLDPKTGVLFYSLVNLNAVACWRTSNKDYTMENQGRIYMSNETMVYASDIKVDYDDNLWILSNRLPLWMYGKLNNTDVNFRIFSAPVVKAISHTTCDITPRFDILHKFVNKVNNVTDKLTNTIVDKFNSLKPNKSNDNSSSNKLTSFSIITLLCLFVFTY